MAVANVAVKAAEVAKVVVSEAVQPLLSHLVLHLVGRHLVGHLVGRLLVGRLVGHHLVGLHGAEVVVKVMVGSGPHPKGQSASLAAEVCSQEGGVETTPARGASDGRGRPEGAAACRSSPPRTADAPLGVEGE